MTAPELRLDADAATVLVRLVLPGERYGPHERFTNTTARSLLDFSTPRAALAGHLGAYEVEHVRDCCTRRATFTPGGNPHYRLASKACRRLTEWLRDPYSAAADALTSLLVGDEVACARTALALRHLGLETSVTGDALRGLAHVWSEVPSLVVVDADTLAPELAEKLCAAARARKAPVLVTTADPDRLPALEVDGVLRTPVAQRDLTAALAGLLDLV